MGVDGPAILNSRLDFNIVDFDYNSREFALWPCCEMKWTLGIRVLSLFFDSQVDQSYNQAAAGSGIEQMRKRIPSTESALMPAWSWATRLRTRG